METVLLAAGALVAVGAGLFGAVVLRRARAIGRRIASLAGDPIEPLTERSTLASASSTLLGSTILLPPSLGGSAPLDEALAGQVGRLSVTAAATVFVTDDGQRHVPHARVVEAALLAEAGGRSATADESLLRLTWERAGERLTTTFAVAGRRVDAERLRREIHVRAGKAPPIAFTPPTR